MRSIKNRLLLKGRKNKKTIITILFALVAMMGQAQEIKMNETTINDYIPMLNQKGYQAYSFDVSAIKGKILHFGMMRRIR